MIAPIELIDEKFAYSLSSSLHLYGSFAASGTAYTPILEHPTLPINWSYKYARDTLIKTDTLFRLLPHGLSIVIFEHLKSVLLYR